MRAVLLALVCLLAISAHAFDLATWKSNLDAFRADLLIEARETILVGDDAEDTSGDFSTAASVLSVSGTALTLGDYVDLGDEFQVCVDVNANSLGASVMHSCLNYAREAIEK